MATTIAQALRQIKSDVARFVRPEVIGQICAMVGHAWRKRVLDPVTTLRVFLLQVLHGNAACNEMPHRLNEVSFTGAAYCAARARLPLEIFEQLLARMGAALENTLAVHGWRGHRTWLLDGSSFSMPDTPALQQHFGQPSGQAPGCGFPVAHLLALFHADTGLVLRALPAPLRTHDMAQASQVHAQMSADDILIADRGFCSYAHLALLLQRKMHGVFRIHQKQIVSFRPGRPYARDHHEHSTGQPRSRWLRRLGRYDQVVEYFKPTKPPSWMSAEQYAALPESIRVRELRYVINRRGVRTRCVTLVTTLLNAKRYSARALADLYGSRWQVETNLRHLKQTMGMDVLRCRTVAGVTKELCMFVVAYNLVRLVMLEAARRQGTSVTRISFIDALRWLRHARPGARLRELVTNPARPGRLEPRVRKRRPKQYPLMKKPRDVLRKALLSKKNAA